MRQQAKPFAVEIRKSRSGPKPTNWASLALDAETKPAAFGKADRAFQEHAVAPETAPKPQPRILQDLTPTLPSLPARREEVLDPRPKRKSVRPKPKRAGKATTNSTTASVPTSKVVAASKVLKPPARKPMPVNAKAELPLNSTPSTNRRVGWRQRRLVLRRGEQWKRRLPPSAW